MTNLVADRPLLSVRDVAEQLSLSERTVRRLIDERGLPALKIGGSICIDPAMLEEWLHAGAVIQLEAEIHAAVERGDVDGLERLRAAYRRVGSLERPIALLRVEEVERDV